MFKGVPAVPENEKFGMEGPAVWRLARRNSNVGALVFTSQLTESYSNLVTVTHKFTAPILNET